jgi:hypothetical protein
MVFIKYLHEGIGFFLGLTLLFFGGEERFFCLSAKLESIF